MLPLEDIDNIHKKSSARGKKDDSNSVRKTGLFSFPIWLTRVEYSSG